MRAQNSGAQNVLKLINFKFIAILFIFVFFPNDNALNIQFESNSSYLEERRY